MTKVLDREAFLFPPSLPAGQKKTRKERSRKGGLIEGGGVGVSYHSLGENMVSEKFLKFMFGLEKEQYD